MAKISKNARTDRNLNKQDSKNMVKIIKAVKDETTGSYSYKQIMVHKDKVKEVLGN